MSSLKRSDELTDNEADNSIGWAAKLWQRENLFKVA